MASLENTASEHGGELTLECFHELRCEKKKKGRRKSTTYQSHTKHMKSSMILYTVHTE